MMLERVARTIAVVVLATVGMIVGVSGPASADSGGGCGAYVNNVKACISVASGTSNPLLLDFYVRGFGRGECYADIAIVYNNSLASPSRQLTPDAAITLNRTGRFGPWSQTKALAHAQAKALVTVWNCSRNVLYVVYSPNQSW